MSKRPLQLLAALALLGMLAGACSNGSSKSNSSGGTGGSGNSGSSNTDTGGLFPSNMVNKAVHTGTPKRGGTLTFGVESDIMTTSPDGNLIQPSDVQMANAAFDSLITFGDEGKYKGVPVLDNTDHHYNQLADKLVSSNNLQTWTLTLRPGLKFANGDTLDAQALVDHTKWIQANAGGCSCKSDAQAITGITKTGPLTVVYQLSTPQIGFPDKLSNSGLGWVIDTKVVEKDPNQGAPAVTNLIGAGPFMYAGPQSGGNYTLTRNPYYYGKDPVNGQKLPYLDKIIFKPLDDSTTRLQAVQSGGVQLMQTADTSNLTGAKSDKSLGVQPSEGSSSTILVLNLTHAPFGTSKGTGTPRDIAKESLDDSTALEARQAFNFAINRNEINQKYYQGARVPAYGFIPESSEWYDSSPDAQLPRYNPVKAKALIKDLKAKGVTTKINALCINTPESTGIFAILKEQAAAVGITPSLKQVEQAILVQTLLAPDTASGTWDVACFRSPQIADPDGIYNALYSKGTTNLVMYNRSNVDTLLNEGRQETNFAKRKAIYDQIQVQVAKDVVYIPLLFDYYGNVYRNNVSGLSTPAPDSLGIIRPGELFYNN